MMWAKILEFVEQKALGLSVKQWMWIALAVAFVVQDFYVYGKGESHALATVNAVVIKQQAKEAKKEEARSKEAIANASKEADKLNELDKTTKTNEDKAHEIATQAAHPADCDLTDAERLYLKSLVGAANSTE